MVLNAANLEGGQAGTSPTATFHETRKYSSNLLYNPVDENFMFTPSAGPNVLVTVNDLMGVCESDCSYTFETTVP